MSRPPLYSRIGNISPSNGTDNAKMGIGSARGGIDGGLVGANPAPAASLLEKAQQFSTFAVRHVEEVRRALARTADVGTPINCEGGSGFGGRNKDEIAATFDELTAAYDKLSSLKWDAARLDFEEYLRAQAGFEEQYPTIPIETKDSEKMEKRVTLMTESNAEEVILEPRGVKDHPWQDDDDMNPHNWIADAFLKNAISSEEEDGGVHSYPINGNLASLNATAEPYANTSLAPKSTSTPPGFKPEIHPNDELIEARDDQVDDSVLTKPIITHSLTSIPSEISSLHTSSIPCDDDEDSDSEYSDTSSSSEEELPSMENFDYLYKGGYAMQASGGKETKGVVPKTVKHVLVDPSVKTIEEGAFQGCNFLQSVTIPSSVEAVGDHAFRKCSKLRKVTFLTKAPKSRRHKQMWDQKRDEKKEEKQSYRRSASAPSSYTEPRCSRLRRIGEWSFFNCSSLVLVTLPHGLESIGTRAFQRCSAMSITELPETLISVGENAFIGCPRDTKAAFESWQKDHSN